MTWARARRGLVLALSLVLALASLVPVLRIRFETDVLQLMPRESGAVDAFETYLERFGSLDALYVYVEAPESGAVADYRDYVHALADALRRLPDVKRVDTGLLDATRDWTYLTDRQLLLLDDRGFDEAVARMAPDRIRVQLRRTRELLALPTPELKAIAQRDPLDWFGLTTARLQGASGVLQLDPSRTDGYVTADGRAQLLVVHPTQPAFDTTYARSLLAHIAEAEARVRAGFARQWSEDEFGAPRTEVAGGHRTAIETESLMRGEAISNTAWSMAGVLGLLYLAFRNAWLVVFGTLPILLGTLVTLARASGRGRAAVCRRDGGRRHALRPRRRRAGAAVRGVPRTIGTRAVADRCGAGPGWHRCQRVPRRHHHGRHLSRPLVHEFPQPAAARHRRRARHAADGALHADGARGGVARARVGEAIARPLVAGPRAVGRPPQARDSGRGAGGLAAAGVGTDEAAGRPTSRAPATGDGRTRARDPDHRAVRAGQGHVPRDEPWAGTRAAAGSARGARDGADRHDRCRARGTLGRPPIHARPGCATRTPGHAGRRPDQPGRRRRRRGRCRGLRAWHVRAVPRTSAARPRPGAGPHAGRPRRAWPR